MTGPPPAAVLAAHLSWLSLISFGGIPVVLPAIHDLVVLAHGWVTDREFADFFALSQILPGPNFIFMMSLIGWKIGGPLGAAAAGLGIAGPACTVTLIAFRFWHRFRDAPWRLAVGRGLVPLTIGLVIAGGWILARAGGAGWRGLVLTAAAAALMLRCRLNPLWLLGAGGVAGGLGLL
ncbi:MAG: chromate transporter [Stellaceae bacterium]|jgi:chromate transporter